MSRRNGSFLLPFSTMWASDSPRPLSHTSLTTHHNHNETVLNIGTMGSFLHRMESRHLSNSDMRFLVRILRHEPAPDEEGYERKAALCRRYSKQDIQELPRRLRSSHLSFGFPSNLCSLHKSLDAHLINDIWAWVKHEYEGAIGKFLYPLIISGRLTTEQEWKIRQLEPVVEMWRKDFVREASPPPGREPIYCGLKWRYQKDQCPACIMTRMGSDEDVLFALFAGMVGRFHTKNLTDADGLGSTFAWDRTKSKRLRFVRHWLKKTRGGYTTICEAGDLGMLLKRLRLQWKHEQRQQFCSLLGTSAYSTPTASTNAYGTNKLPRTSIDPKVGPNPRPATEVLLSPAEPLGFDVSRMRSHTSTVPQGQQNTRPAFHCNPYTASETLNNTAYLSTESLKPIDSRSVVASAHAPAPFCIPRKPLPPRIASSIYSRQDDSGFNIGQDSSESSLISPTVTCSSPLSLASARTILSYTGGPSERANHIDSFDNPIYNTIETQEQRIEKYRRLLAVHPLSDPYALDDDDDDDDDEDWDWDGDGDDEESVVFRAGLVFGAARPELVSMPSRKSMYAAYGDEGFDEKRYDGVDKEVRVEEIEGWKKDAMGGDEDRYGDEVVREDGKEGLGERRRTRWDDLY